MLVLKQMCECRRRGLYDASVVQNVQYHEAGISQSKNLKINFAQGRRF
jgi:hypothetical protein